MRSKRHEPDVNDCRLPGRRVVGARHRLSAIPHARPEPDNVGMVGLNGTFDSNELTGTVIGAGCSTFEVERDRAESTRSAARQAGPPPPTATTPRPSLTTPAASRPRAAATGRTFCHNQIDQPVVYVSGIVDTGLTHDILEIEPEEILQFAELELDFALFLNGRYGRPLPPPDAATGNPVGGATLGVHRRPRPLGVARATGEGPLGQPRTERQENDSSRPDGRLLGTCFSRCTP